MRYNSKGMTCEQFVELMRERGITYNAEIGRFVKKNGCIKGKQNKNGYRTISLNKNHVEYTFCEHRCVWVWLNGAIPDGYEINHIDAERGNNRIENLELVTHSENMRHAVKIGNFNAKKAEDSGRAVFSNDEVRTMRYLYAQGWTIKQIGALFGKEKYWVSVGRLVKGIRYGSVQDDIQEWKAHEIIKERMKQQQIGRVL